MAELKNIRGNYLAQKLGNFPLDCECLNYAQKRDDISQALGCIGGDRVLLSGFNADGSGLVFVKTNECPWGEVMPVKAGSGSTLHLVSEPVRVDFSAEDVFPQAYFDRYLEYGTVYGAGAENFPVASFWKLRNNKVIYEALQAEMQTREAADSSIRQSVNSLSSSLSSEQSARDTAVRALKEQLLREIRSEVSSASSTAANSLSAEVTALNKRIADLESTLSAQIANAQNSADTAAEGLASTQYVNQLISKEADRANQYTDDRISTEVEARQTAVSTLEKRIDDSLYDLVPVGTIVAWGKDFGEIPRKWHLCNGQMGTPDLQGYFIIGGQSPNQYTNRFKHKTYTDRIYKNKTEIQLTVENLPAHRHLFAADTNGVKFNSVTQYGDPKKGHSGEGSGTGVLALTGSSVYEKDSESNYNNTTPKKAVSDEFSILPPYYALAYIMKIE